MCASCVSAVEDELSALPGVKSVAVNLLMCQGKRERREEGSGWRKRGRDVKRRVDGGKEGGT
eukprot:364020-Chlamydomonas_euryale.AAC.3